MQFVQGSILASTPLLDNSVFEQKVIVLAEHNQQGALGFVINDIFPRKFNELTAFSTSKPWPLFDGGPVEREALFFIHRRPDIIDGGTRVLNNVFMGGNFVTAVEALNQQQLLQEDIKLFIGYCGWNAGELEAEIAEGSWIVSRAAVETAFEYDVDDLWSRLYDHR